MKEYPQLLRENNRITLLSEGAPYLIFGGEIHNSSASDLKYLERSVWPALRGLHLNTVLVPVSWELLEPEPDHFDFTLPDGIIAQAEKEGVKLIFLWFGLWKNGKSTYVPEWMKADRERYFLMQDRRGQRIEAISPLCAAAVKRDAAAFTALMKHLREFDLRRTVLMVQVENEMGLLGDCRDFSPAAQQAWNNTVPIEVADLYSVTGTWKETLGEQAPELFMSYWYAKAVEQIAAAGRSAYPIPLYVNAWLEQYPWIPGTYPSGGPIARHHALWRKIAPSIDFFAPDCYLPDFEKVCAEYTEAGNPLFIPEARPCMDTASNVFSAFGHFGALGISPFAVEDLNRECSRPDPEILKNLNIMAEAFNVYRSGEYLAKSYALLRGIYSLLVRYRGTSHMAGFTQHQDRGTLVKMHRCNFLISYTPHTIESPKAGGLVIELGEDEFLLCGLNFKAEPLSKNDEEKQVRVISLTEGHYEQERWIPERRLNGDEFHLAFGSTPTLLRCHLCWD